MTQHLNGTSPALDLLRSLWSDRPLRTVKMRPSGAKYITLKDQQDRDITITDVMLADHVQGTATYACPLIGADGLARSLAIELDAGAEAGAQQMLDIAGQVGLVAFAIVCPGSDGHDGSHTWALYDQEWSPERLQEQSRQLLRAAGLPEKEVYPSNANIRLPFGLHVRTKQRGVLLLQDGRRFDLDTYDGLVEAISTVCALPRNTAPPPASPERAQAFFNGGKVRPAGDITPLDDYDARCSREEVEQLLTDAGWTELRRRGSVGYWQRPGKAKHDGHSATLGHVADTVLSVFSEKDPDLPGDSGRGKHYGPAKIYTHLLHGGNFSAAGKDLYAKGYGTRAAATVAAATVAAAPKGISRSFVFACLNQGEAGDAQLVEELYRGQLVYDHAAGAWYTFGSHAWSSYDGTPRRLIWSRVAAAYLGLAAQIQGELDQETDDAKKKTMLAWVDALTERAKKLRSVSRINNVLLLAQELLGIKGNEWDANPWLLGVENGTLDLCSGQLRNGNPEDYIRTVAPTKWRGLDVPAPRWMRFINEVMSDETDRVAFLQRLLGYALNGSTKEHVLTVCIGARGRNGKRVLFETLQHVLGDYAGAVSTDVLIGQDHKRIAGSAQPHLVALQGRRIAYCSETNEHNQLNAAQVKNITGGDRIRARNLFEKDIVFDPSHTLFLQTNRKPQATADDDALWERVKVIEFKVRFVDEPSAADERPRDLQLESTLQAEASGILAWLVRGGLEWQRGGLRTPSSVRWARDTYRKEESIEPFLDAACVEANGLSAEGGALYAAYESWCKANGLRAKSPVWFGKQLQQRFEKGRTVPGRVCYYGLGLETSEFEAPTADNPSEIDTTLQNPSEPSGTPNTTPERAGVYTVSEGLGSISDRFEGHEPHEGDFMKNPSDPSDPSENAGEQVIPPPPAGRVITLRDGTAAREMIPTAEWQYIPEGWHIPPGCESRINVTTGSKQARLPESSPAQTAVGLVDRLRTIPRVPINVNGRLALERQQEEAEAAALAAQYPDDGYQEAA